MGAFIFITAVIFDSAYCIPFLFLANIDNISLIPDISTSGESIMTSKSTSTRFYETALSYSQGTHFYSTLQGTNISPKNGILKMIFLFPRWDMLIPWRVPSSTLPKTKSQCPWFHGFLGLKIGKGSSPKHQISGIPRDVSFREGNMGPNSQIGESGSNCWYS